VPMNQCLFFETGKTEGVLKKIAEFGAEVVPPLGSEAGAYTRPLFPPHPKPFLT